MERGLAGGSGTIRTTGLLLLAAATLSATRAEAQDAPLDPLDHMVELGFFGGGFLPSRFHPFFEAGVANHRPLRAAMGDVGLRLGYFPLSFLGVEAEGVFLPGAGIAEGDSVTMFGARGHLMLQLPWRFSFFLLAGGGVTGLSSDANQLGSAMEPGFYWGPGLKFFVHRYIALRFEGRHVLTSVLSSSDDSVASHAELLLGLSFTFNRVDPDYDEDGVPDYKDRCVDDWGEDDRGCPQPDYDGDGIVDKDDKCPRQPGVAERQGCAPPEPPPPDRDGDGVRDERDRCPDEKGVAPSGCPDPDPDRDGVPADRDQCPNEPGSLTDGCPIRDGDNDNVPDAQDQCKTEPETRNGYKDDDGCPDEIPKAVKAFSGRLEGILFQSGKAKILPASFKILDKVVAVMKEFPEFRVEISGHTDDKGEEADNQKLSEARANAVKDYLVSKGIPNARIVATGYGESRPVMDNDLKGGREKNRRIEFNIIP